MALFDALVDVVLSAEKAYTSGTGPQKRRWAVARLLVLVDGGQLQLGLPRFVLKDVLGLLVDLVVHVLKVGAKAPLKPKRKRKRG